MPCNGARAFTFATVFCVITYCVPSGAVRVMGFCGLTRVARSRSLFSRRCTPWVPTYPAASTQFFPRERSKVRFHCCNGGAIHFLGTVTHKVLITLPE